MKNFLNELQKISPDLLPGITETGISERKIKKITERVHKNISEPGYAQKKPRTVSCRRIVSLLAAAVLMIALTTAVYAYRDVIYTGMIETGEAIREFFTREEILIDQKAQIIGESAENERITVSVEKAVRDGDQEYLYASIINNMGTFDGLALTCDEIILEKKTEVKYGRGFREKYAVVTKQNMGITGIYAGDMLCLLRDNPTDTVEIMLPLDISEAGVYRLTFVNLFTVKEEMIDGEYTGNLPVTEYADELTVNFTIDSELESLDKTEIYPMTEFEVGGASLTLGGIYVTPIEITVDILDMIGQTVEVGGYETEAIDYLRSFQDLCDILRNDTELSGDNYSALYREIMAEAYRVCIDFFDDTLTVNELESGASWAYPYDENLVRYTFRMNTPVYFGDIEKIYLENAQEPADIIVIWEAGETEQ